MIHLDLQADCDDSIQLNSFLLGAQMRIDSWLLTVIFQISVSGDYSLLTTSCELIWITSLNLKTPWLCIVYCQVLWLWSVEVSFGFQTSVSRLRNFLISLFTLPVKLWGSDIHATMATRLCKCTLLLDSLSLIPIPCVGSTGSYLPILCESTTSFVC